MTQMKSTTRFGTTVRSDVQTSITGNDVMIEILESGFRHTEASARRNLEEKRESAAFWNAERQRTQIRIGNRPCVRKAFR